MKRGMKAKTFAPPGQFIALGAKTSRPPDEAKHSTSSASSLPKPSPSLIGSERKREASSGSISLPSSKKPKLSAAAPTSSKSSVTADIIKKEPTVSKTKQWESAAIEINPADFLRNVLEAEEAVEEDRIDSLLCGAVKYIKANKSKVDSGFMVTLFYLAKTKPAFFCTDYVIEAFCSLLRKDSTYNPKMKGHALPAILAANVLMAAFEEEKVWPEAFVKVYVEDVLNERVWVDYEGCKGFVENILQAFPTRHPPKHMLIPELSFKPDACPSPTNLAIMEDDEMSDGSSRLEGLFKQDVPVQPRFASSQESICQYVMEIIKDNVTKRQPQQDVSRNIVRLLCLTCGYPEVRLVAAQRVEMWLQNAKLARPAQELLLYICTNCDQHNQMDVEIITILGKIRLKSKPLLNHFLMCIRELLNQHPENLGVLLKHTIYNELTNSRNPNNMPVIGVLFSHSSEKSAKILAEIFQDLLTNRDDYLRCLRILLREIVRTLRHDMNFISFCLGLMQERTEKLFLDLDQGQRERMFVAVADLVTLSIFLAISPAVKEAAVSYARGDKKDLSVLKTYQQQVSLIQRDSVWWLHVVVPKMYKPSRTEFIHCLHKVLFMESAEHYYKIDNWPVEQERPLMLRLASDSLVVEDTLMRILIVGLSKEKQLNPPDALELADQMIRRAASLYHEDIEVIPVQKLTFIDALFNICAYHHPENITLPAGYQPPTLAISNLYWKAWVMLVIITAHNPSTFGYAAWEKYPTLCALMEMCITNQFVFPPPTMAIGEKADEMRSQELQLVELEKQQILEFETHLASVSAPVTITENNSLLLAQLTSMDPGGVQRRPPNNVIELLKQLNGTLRIGHLLCRSRNPDFLLEIIHRQGTSQSMPWLAELVQSSDSAFSVLPIQCLCEFLLTEMPEPQQSESDDREEESKAEKVKRKEKQHKHQQLLYHLQTVVHNNSEDPQNTIEMLDYFLRRLSSTQAQSRQQAVRGFNLVLCLQSEEDMETDVKEEHAWLLNYLPAIPHFQAVSSYTTLGIRQACLIENNSGTVSAYIRYLSMFASDDQLLDLAPDMAQLIVERATMMSALLPLNKDGAIDIQGLEVYQAFLSIFNRYLEKAREPSKEGYSWSQSQDQILVQWSTGEAATMTILVAHAIMMLLTFGPPPHQIPYFEELMEMWFPESGELPQSFLVDTSEEALLLPDWLKLKMIRSSVERLVDIALKDLEPSQLVLFIQSFGIPIKTVTKLLHALDLAVDYDSEAVEQSVVDKSYMAQLVGVQKERGATGGVKFAEFLTTSSNQSSSDVAAETQPLFHRRPPVMVTAAPSLPNLDNVAACLVSLFLPDSTNAVDLQTQRNLFKTLYRAMSSEVLAPNVTKPVIQEVVVIMTQFLMNRHANVFVSALHRHCSFSCPIFKLLITVQKKEKSANKSLYTQISGVFSHLIAKSVGIKSPLMNVLRQAECANSEIVNSGQEQRDVKAVLNWIEQCAKGAPLTEEKIINVIKQVACEQPSRLENVVKKIANVGIQRNNLRIVIASCCRLLLEEGSSNNKYGFLVDWLEMLEPEIVAIVQDLELKLLLEKVREEQQQTSVIVATSAAAAGIVKTREERIVHSCRPYLLSALIHNASWRTIHGVVDLVLNRSPGVPSPFDAASVLDVLWACIHNPKIWRGKDKHLSKHHEDEDVLQLTASQTVSVADYILEEAMRAECGASSVNEKTNRTVIESWVPLLVYCCKHQDSRMTKLVEHLQEKMLAKTAMSRLAQQLLLHIYLQVPKVIKCIKNKADLLNDSIGIQQLPSSFDVTSHNLLTSLAWIETDREWSGKLQDLEMAARKMASEHPILLLRQLPMLAVALRGRVQLEFHVLRSRHHLAVFSSVLGLLELLQPQVFRSEHETHLHDLVGSYLNLFKYHSKHTKDLSPMLHRLCSLLQNYLSVDAKQATVLIQANMETILELLTAFPEAPSLFVLARSCKTPQNRDSETRAKYEELMKPVNVKFRLPPAEFSVKPSVVNAIMTRLTNTSNPEDILGALQDIDNLSQKRVQALKYFVEELKGLVHHLNDNCRNLAHNLILRYVKEYPDAASKLVNTYLQCLDSKNHNVVLTALKTLPEFSLLAQERAGILLQKAFVLGFTSNIDTQYYISEAVMLFQMQNGN